MDNKPICGANKALVKRISKLEKDQEDLKQHIDSAPFNIICAGALLFFCAGALLFVTILYEGRCLLMNC